MTTPADTSFLDAVTPLLAERSQAEVAAALRTEWPADKLVALLVTTDPRVRRAALECLGLIGAMEHCRYIALMLRTGTPEVAAAAEDSLWKIWMRSGSAWGVRTLRRAIDYVQNDRSAEALELLNVLTNSEPTYAEPHHQLGIALSLAERGGEALRSYRQTLRLNPYHYAAAQGAGQIYLERGVLRRAYDYYQHALQIHPRLEPAAEIARGLRQALGEASDSA